MNRRHLFAVLGAAGLLPLRAQSQQKPLPPHIGYLRYGSAAASANRVAALRAGLRDLGYIDGENIVLEFRWAERFEQLAESPANWPP